MTGSGSPCGACKFLRRKCVKGCVFAPYFCHEEGATNFSAIHRVFGASNFSKLLSHLSVGDRCEAAVTISYEAQARLQDPIYGCVSHIFALQQQVVNLQAQLASMKEQAGQTLVNTNPNDNSRSHIGSRLPSYQENVQTFKTEDSVMMLPDQINGNGPTNIVENNSTKMPFYGNGLTNILEGSESYENYVFQEENPRFLSFEEPCYSMASLNMQTRSNIENFQSMGFGYTQR